MPDYNPSVALGINSQGPDLSKTLETVNQLQIGQAHLGLYNLQALQQQRQYNALQTTAAYVRDHPNDAQGALQTFYGYGGNPADGPSIVNSLATANAVKATGIGTLPSEAKSLAEIPGAVAGSNKAGTEADASVAKQYGPAVLLNPSDDGAWHQLVTAHAQAVSTNPATRMTPMEVQAALNIKDPAMRMDGAIRYGTAAGVPLDKLAETFKAYPDVNPNDTSLTMAQRVGAAPVPSGTVLRQPGEVAQAKAQAEKQGAYFSNLYSGIAASGNTAANARDDINIAKSVINDPQFYSGTAEGANLAYKRALASFGVDPGASLPQEAFRKVMSQNILQQVNGLRAAQEEMGAAGGRIFQSQIEMMEKAAQNPDNSIAANRFLTELADRSSQRNMKIADMAANYKGGKLDAAFEKQLRDYTNKNPLFSDQELKFPKLIGMDPKERQYLRDHPETAPQFDAYYGGGASRAIIGQ